MRLRYKPNHPGSSLLQDAAWRHAVGIDPPLPHDVCVVAESPEVIIRVDAVANWVLSIVPVKAAHQTLIHNLAVHALADGVVTDTERSHLHQVAKLLGHDDRELDHPLESAGVQ